MASPSRLMAALMTPLRTRRTAVLLATGAAILAGATAAAGTAATQPVTIATGQDAGWPEVRGWTRIGDTAEQIAPWGNNRSSSRRTRPTSTACGSPSATSPATASPRSSPRQPRAVGRRSASSTAPGATRSARSRRSEAPGGGTAPSSRRATRPATARPRSSTASTPASRRQFTFSTRPAAQRQPAFGPTAEHRDRRSGRSRRPQRRRQGRDPRGAARRQPRQRLRHGRRQALPDLRHVPWRRFGGAEIAAGNVVGRSWPELVAAARTARGCRST